MNLIDEIKHTFNRNDNAIRRIILLNVSVFLVFAVLDVCAFLFGLSDAPVSTLRGYLMLPASFYNFIKQPWSIVTYMFLHAGFMHILFNMLWLFWIGNLLHEYLGNRKVYEAYFAAGIFGGLLYMICYNVFPAFSAGVHSSYALGASAGVLGVVFAAATLLPEYPINLLLFGVVRLKYVAIIPVIIDLISIPNGNAGGHIAHIGGALAGFLYIRFIYKYGNLVPDRIANLFSRKPKMKVHYRTTYTRPVQERKPSQDEVDSILDKISKSGYDSLTKREKEILFKASKE